MTSQKTDKVSFSSIQGALPVLLINESKCTKEPSPPEVVSSMDSVGTLSHACLRAAVVTAPTLHYQQAYNHHWSEWTKLRYLSVLNLKSRLVITKSILNSDIRNNVLWQLFLCSVTKRPGASLQLHERAWLLVGLCVTYLNDNWIAMGFILSLRHRHCQH